MAPVDIDIVNAPAFAGATRVAGHPPSQPGLHNRGNGQVHCGRDEATRVAAPSLAASDWTASSRADRAVIATCNKAAANLEDVPIGLSLVNTNLQHSAIESEGWILLRCFEIEIMPECYPGRGRFEETETLQIQ